MDKRRLRIGIIGAGSRGIMCFGKLIEKHVEASITALCDPNHVRMEHGRQELGGTANCYMELEDMLAREPLDAVIITSPDKFHEEHAVKALQAGCHVLVDKPLAINVSGCQTILDAAATSEKTVMIGFNLRHHAVLKRLKQIIDEGTLGRVFLVENREFYDGGRTYMSRWNRKYEISGGLWVHKGSHDFDVFNWLLGFPKPRQVTASAGINVLTKDHIPFDVDAGSEVGPTCSECAYKETCPDVYDVADGGWGEEARGIDNYSKDLCIYTSDKDVHDNGIAIVEYENGIRASHLECFVTGICDRLYTVVGDRGQAEVSLTERTIRVRPRWSGEVVTYTVPEADGGHGGADPGLVDTFIEVAKGTAGNTSTAEQGLWATAIGQAAEVASRENRVVTIDELFNK